MDFLRFFGVAVNDLLRCFSSLVSWLSQPCEKHEILPTKFAFVRVA